MIFLVKYLPRQLFITGGDIFIIHYCRRLIFCIFYK